MPDGSGISSTPQSGDNVDANGYSIDVADVYLIGIGLSGGNFYSSKWYATSGSSHWNSVTWSSEYSGCGMYGSPSGTCAVDSNTYSGIDITDVDLTNITLAGSGFVYSTLYAQNSDEFMYVTWNTHNAGFGQSQTADTSNSSLTLNSGSHTVYVSDLDLYYWYCTRSGNWSSMKWYASGSAPLTSINWRSATSGTYLETYNPPTPSTLYSYGNYVDVAGIDLTGYTLDSSNGGGFTSSSWYAQDSAAWASVTWNSHSSGLGISGSPSTSENHYVYSNGYTIDMVNVSTYSWMIYWNGDGWTSSLWYAASDGDMPNVTWNATASGDGIVGAYGYFYGSSTQTLISNNRTVAIGTVSTISQGIVLTIIGLWTVNYSLTIYGTLAVSNCTLSVGSSGNVTVTIQGGVLNLVDGGIV